MAVKRFKLWLKSTFPEAFKKATVQDGDCIYIDMNGVLHMAFRKAKNLAHCAKRLNRRLDNITRPLKSSSVVLAVDGPPPLSKSKTQRERRRTVKPGVFDIRYLTPGTTFMNELNEWLVAYACKISPSRRSVILDGAASPGEGELKIIKHIKQSKAPRHVIYGSDSDILLQCIASNVSNVVVVSEQDMFCVDTFKSLLKKHFPGKSQTRIMTDITFLSCLLGTDYFPSMKHSSLKWLMAHYKREHQYLVDLTTQAVDLQVLAKILLHPTPSETRHGSYMESMEEDIVDDEGVEEGVEDEEDDSDTETPKESYLNIELNGLVQYYFNGTYTYQPRKFQSLPRTPSDMCTNYLQAISWCLLMFTNGHCHDFQFMYAFPNAPTRQELYDYCLQSSSFNMNPSQSPALPPALISALVLPMEAIHMIDPPFQSLLSLYHERQEDPLVHIDMMASFKDAVRYYKSQNVRLFHCYPDFLSISIIRRSPKGQAYVPCPRIMQLMWPHRKQDMPFDIVPNQLKH